MFSFRTGSYNMYQQGIDVHVEVEDIHLGIDTAIPCRLIINELVSNAFKPAFTPGMKGRVCVELHSNPSGTYTLTVQDNGKGLPEDLDWHNSSSLGLRLVSDLTKQLDASLDVQCRGGTTFEITFAEIQYKERR